MYQRKNSTILKFASWLHNIVLVLLLSIKTYSAVYIPQILLCLNLKKNWGTNPHLFIMEFDMLRETAVYLGLTLFNLDQI